MATDHFAHIPFVPEDVGDLTVGSFVSGLLEDDFMAAIWRLRRWNFYGTLTRVPTSGPPVLEFDDAAGPGYILNGENNFSGTETSAFADLSDILTTWRETRSYAGPGGPGDAGIDIRWGPRGNYDISGGTAGGLLDSELLVTATDGDTEYFIGTQQGRDVGGPDGGILDTSADVDFQFYDCDGNLTSVTLYFPKTGMSPVIDNWTGTLIMVPGDLWWPWTINGDDTWDTATGAQLEDPLRTWVSGEPRYACKQA